MPLAQTIARCTLAAMAAAPLLACESKFMLKGTVTDGVIEHTHETFMGTAADDWPNKPTLEILTNTGARCVGDIYSISDREATGHLHCSDGRRGTFAIVSTDLSGAAGFGDLGGKRIGFVVK